MLHQSGSKHIDHIVEQSLQAPATTARVSPEGSAIAALGSNHRRTVDDIDRKVIAHVLEYGRISNRTIQNLLDIDVYRARDLLRDLRDRGLLVKTSTQERGIAVEYGPGAKLPHPKRQRKPRDPYPPGDDTLFGED